MGTQRVEGVGQVRGRGRWALMRVEGQVSTNQGMDDNRSSRNFHGLHTLFLPWKEMAFLCTDNQRHHFLSPRVPVEENHLESSNWHDTKTYTRINQNRVYAKKGPGWKTRFWSTVIWCWPWCYHNASSF